ncbi:Hsp70 family protein [Colwelliaceae bacterium BS250]
MNSFCGLDFGTSNSTFGTTINKDGEHSPILIPLEDNKVTLPSAVFFHFDDNCAYYGREAINEYIEGEFGRLMRSLKSVLGTPLMNENTQVKTANLPFVDIVSAYLKNMKMQAEQNSQQTFSHVVMGRPVHFVDNDLEADLLAQDTLEQAAIRAGFDEVLFQYEPIAAALEYEQQVDDEEIALIVDIGGGTADFSVVRISPERAQHAERKDDILANGGVHIGGTDFDRKLSLASVMPELGYNSYFKDKNATANFEKSFSIRKSVSSDTYTESTKMMMPSYYYHDLATWHKIHTLYERPITHSLKDIAYRVENKQLIDRLIHLIHHREGHRLAIDIEQAKIDLTNAATAHLDLDYVEDDLTLEISETQLHDAVKTEISSIQAHAWRTVQDAGLVPTQITKVFMTGGTTAIPIVKQAIEAIFPHTDIVQGDQFGSVGLGLAIDASRKFG